METTSPHLLLFDPDHNRSTKSQTENGLDPRTKEDRRLYCIRCRHQITHEDERIPVQGGIEHTFSNPDGFVFHIGCFRNAHGCTAVGVPTMEHTWFSGYSWRIALCARCETHLGWWFSAAGNQFYGLIVDRLSAAGPAKH